MSCIRSDTKFVKNGKFLRSKNVHSFAFAIQSLLMAVHVRVKLYCSLQTDILNFFFSLLASGRLNYNRCEERGERTEKETKTYLTDREIHIFIMLYLYQYYACMKYMMCVCVCASHIYTFIFELKYLYF